VRLEGLGLLKNIVTSSGIEPRELPACSIVLQTTTLPRAPVFVKHTYKFLADRNSMFYFLIYVVYMRKCCDGENNGEFDGFAGFSFPENENVVFGMRSVQVLSYPGSR
jgi:hypothetical protein